MAVVQCSIRPRDASPCRRDHEAMNQLDVLLRNLPALAAAALPAIATATAELLDQSTRRPSLARLVMHSLQYAF